VAGYGLVPFSELRELKGEKRKKKEEKKKNPWSDISPPTYYVGLPNQLYFHIFTILLVEQSFLKSYFT